jgi:hypothetical protein
LPLLVLNTKDEEPFLVSSYMIYFTFYYAKYLAILSTPLTSNAENKEITMKQDRKTVAKFTAKSKHYAVLAKFNELTFFWAYSLGNFIKSNYGPKLNFRVALSAQ